MHLISTLYENNPLPLFIYFCRLLQTPLVFSWLQSHLNLSHPFNFLSSQYFAKLSSYATPLDLLISFCSSLFPPLALSLSPPSPFFLTLFSHPLQDSAPAADAV